MNREVPNYDPDDFFSHTRMSFGDHIEDLRRHLFRAIAGFLIAMILCFFVGEPILHFMASPVEIQLKLAYWKRYRSLEEEKKNDPAAFNKKYAPPGAEEKDAKDEIVMEVTPLKPLLAKLQKYFVARQDAIAAVADDELIELPFVKKKAAQEVNFNDVVARDIRQGTKTGCVAY